LASHPRFQGQLGIVHGQAGNSYPAVAAKIDRAFLVDMALNLAPPTKKFLPGLDSPDQVIAWL
jgi:hypothetical protein